MSAKSPGLEAELRARIDQAGPIGFDEFMAAALYDPRHGYYASGKSRTGKGGDFFTSVSVGPVFGKLLAAQFLEMRAHLGNPENFTLVEQGANDGQLLADILAAWTGPLPRVIVIEPIETLRAVQRKTLARWSTCVSHVAQESELAEFEGVFFANELLDAFPVKIFVRESGCWFERRVGTEGGRFVFVETLANETPVFATHVADSIPRIVREVLPSLET
ncbi:MAG: SAM-dependent methyltransferase [Chthoniobacterales bacterium]